MQVLFTVFPYQVGEYEHEIEKLIWLGFTAVVNVEKCFHHLMFLARRTRLFHIQGLAARRLASFQQSWEG
jgi:hypothetical protein